MNGSDFGGNTRSAADLEKGVKMTFKYDCRALTGLWVRFGAKHRSAADWEKELDISVMPEIRQVWIRFGGKQVCYDLEKKVSLTLTKSV